MKTKVDLMIDSGAYGAWTQGKQVSLREYIKFLKVWTPYLWNYVCLDSIPGEPHTPRSHEDVATAAKRSHRNQQTMKDAGLAPIPVFHQGEDPKWLEKMMDDKEPYIGVSPLYDTSVQEQMDFLDLCYSIICDAKGRPLAKTHGFGTTTFRYLHRYPMTTADSTSWNFGVGYGYVMLPHLNLDGTPDFNKRPMSGFLTGAMIGDARGGSRKLNHSTELLRAAIDKYLKTTIGCDMQRMRYDTYWRRRAAITYLDGVAKAASGKPFNNRIGSLLQPLRRFTGKPVKADRAIVYAGMLSRDRSRALNDMDVRKRLLPYMEFARNPEAVAIYVENGTVSDKIGVNSERPGVTNRDGRWSRSYLNFRALAMLDRLDSYNERIPDGYEDEVCPARQRPWPHPRNHT